MSPIKRFLIGFAAVYLTVPFIVLALLGPPGFSRAFLDKHQDGLDRYLEITKSQEYKLWSQNPDAHPPSPEMQKDIALVQEFEAMPEFQQETQRRALYGGVMDLFNSTMFVVLVLGLGRGPIKNLLDNMVTQERQRIEQAEEIRSAAARHKSEAEHRLESIEEEREQSQQAIAKRIEDESARIEEATARALEQLRREAEDRKRQEEARARKRLKAALIDEAIEVLTEQYQKERDANREKVLVGRFLAELGERK